jgi:hypothetical protein
VNSLTTRIESIAFQVSMSDGSVPYPRGVDVGPSLRRGPMA